MEIIKKENCSGCHACYSACPKKCIMMKTDEEGFKYPKVNTDICINCGLCEKICPVSNKRTETELLPLAYAAKNKNENIRLNSSSGGIFTLLAEWVINKGGVVFGATFADDFKSVHHISVDNIDDLEKLRGSKYLQSSIDDSYIEAEKYLKSGQLVLFTGTPCQIGGLKAYLKRDYDNLFTQDLICHGAPSPLVWKKYVELREKEAASKTRRTFFRHKKNGWKTYSVQFEFENCTEYIQIAANDLYTRGFLANLYLRPSCYECSFKSLDRQSDITLADFWGIQNVLPEMDDDKGTSLVLVNSEKGQKLWSEISSDVERKQVDAEKAISYNSAAIQSVKLNTKREMFMRDIPKYQVDEVIKKYTRISFMAKVKRKIIIVLSKFKHMILK